MSEDAYIARAKVVLATTGTLGDLHPFIRIALCLQRRGYEPVIATSGHYRSKVEGQGLSFHPMRPDELERQRHLGIDGREITRRLMVARGPEGPAFVVRELILPYLKQSYEDMMAATQGASLVITSSFAYGATLAAEKRELPYVNVALQPFMFLCPYNPPAALSFPWLRAISPAIARKLAGLFLAIMERTTASWAGPVHELRRELGLPPVSTEPLMKGQFSPFANIGLYSSVFGSVQPGYPPNTTITGFALYDSEEGLVPALAPDLEQFLSSGARPLVFALGSQAVLNAQEFFSESIAVARSLNKRAVLIVGDQGREQLPADIPEQIRVVNYAPYSLVFPRAEIVVHHGGIGTTAQALRSGRPQLIVPFFGDQHDNAARVAGLGVARIIRRRKYGVDSASRALTQLMNDPTYARKASEIGNIVATEDGGAEVAGIIDGMLKSGD